MRREKNGGKGKKSRKEGRDNTSEKLRVGNAEG